MKVLLVVLAGLVGLVLIAILTMGYLLKRHTRSLEFQHLVDSAKQIPTIPMMDPDSFETPQEPTEVGAP